MTVLYNEGKYPLKDILSSKLDSQRNAVTNKKAAEQIWVTTKEGAEITGYHPRYLQQLANKNWSMSESERVIQVRNRSNRYELWLPDLYKYIAEHGTGPQEHDHHTNEE